MQNNLALLMFLSTLPKEKRKALLMTLFRHVLEKIKFFFHFICKILIL